MVLVSPTKRCGKTSVLIVLYFLTPRSELSSNITAPALFRYIEDVRPTLLIDEADSFVKDNEELRGILNSGHTKAAANVIRNVDHKPRRFSTWAPKAIATIRTLAETLEDRAVVVRLQRKPPGATVERLGRRDNAEFAALRSQAARWADGSPLRSNPFAFEASKRPNAHETGTTHEFRSVREDLPDANLSYSHASLDCCDHERSPALRFP